ncbi:MAG: poly-beta-1,6-N-acetyl-D-glucosamine biosynthesis protein PgaD [Castellaniella sp.]|nr:MAG: poly-beta-1,6-N-acetyl-D-glucosamine biosynthesis protein PgaD [Castellaniella sp.]
MIIKTPRTRAVALIDFLLTALAWFAFCYLFAAGIRPILEGRIHGLTAPIASQLLPHAHTLLVYALVAVGIALLLLAWAGYNALRFGGLDRRKPPTILTDADLAASFSIDPAQLKVLHDSQITCVHHTDEGQISLIDFARERHPPDNVVQMPRTAADNRYREEMSQPS